MLKVHVNSVSSDANERPTLVHEHRSDAYLGNR